MTNEQIKKNLMIIENYCYNNFINISTFYKFWTQVADDAGYALVEYSQVIVNRIMDGTLTALLERK